MSNTEVPIRVPLTSGPVTYGTSCATDDACANPLYVYDGQHVRLCGNTCQRLFTSILQSEVESALRNQGLMTPLPPLPVDVTWGYSCGMPIPDAGLIESDAASPPSADAGADAGGGGSVDAGPAPGDASIDGP